MTYARRLREASRTSEVVKVYSRIALQNIRIVSVSTSSFANKSYDFLARKRCVLRKEENPLSLGCIKAILRLALDKFFPSFR